MHTYISLFCHLRGPKNSDNPVAMRIFSSQTYFKCILQQREPEFIGEMPDSRTRV